ncbi:MAG: succinate dehydrogenase cytochrome b subunit [Actinobacteria bacterium]|nr:succinate dehydrogenase cytochrome b subunit [Actinomycetota bacterium]
MPRVTTTNSLTPVQQRALALRSTVILKAAMAISGLIMVLFLLVHMYGNLHVFAGQAVFDNYSHSFRTLVEPYLPYSGALWIIRVTLLTAVLIHVYSAVTLWMRARGATGGRGGWRYQSAQARGGAQRTYASYTMRWGGVTLALFIVFHLLHLTTNTISPGGASSSPYERVVNGFGIWWVTVSYLIAVIALGFHLRHGFWSAFATLGANTSLQRRQHLNVAATAVALAIALGFLAPPFSILFGWVG